jgi:glycine cleavage system H protein
MNVPDDLRYTAEHEWVRTLEPASRVRIGITDFAQDALGDVVFVDLPGVGDSVAAGAAIGELESTKSVSEMYAPIGGTVAAVNEALADQPGLVNDDPYGDGWLVELDLDADADLASLLDASAYRELSEG